MADKVRFPQIPSTVWWGVRTILSRSPKTVIDERLLGIELSVQAVAAKQYLAELNAVGIIDENGRATDLALKWRLEGPPYYQAVGELISNVYPQGLRDVAPSEEGDRQKAITWFLHEGYGEGAAKNKAATYFLLGSKIAGESPAKNGSARTNDSGTKQTMQRTARTTQKRQVNKQQQNGGQAVHDGKGYSDAMPLNVNVQIHISADAGSEQIESIFAAMRRYLHDQQTS